METVCAHDYQHQSAGGLLHHRNFSRRAASDSAKCAQQIESSAKIRVCRTQSARDSRDGVVRTLLYVLPLSAAARDAEYFDINGLSTVALFHTFGAFMLIAFFIAHVYLTTTGHTPTANLKAMVTGYEEQPVDDDAALEQEHA